jgi:hypothetical protein
MIATFCSVAIDTSRTLNLAVGKRDTRLRNRLLPPYCSRLLPSVKSRSSTAMATAPQRRV